MTDSQSGLGLPLASVIAGNQNDAEDQEGSGPIVGADDVAADAAGSGADTDLTQATRDSDGVPVGSADHEADKHMSGA